MRLVIPGGSGNVGTLLARHFHEQGYAVTVLSRRPAPAPWQVLPWDGLTPGPWTAALDGADACINLAGRSVNTRATAKHRRQIYDSRLLSTRMLGQVMAKLSRPPKVWLNASTATIYRHALDHGMDEVHGELGGNKPGEPASWAFSVEVARDWEAAFFAAATPAIRRVAMRSALVLSPDPGSIFGVLSRLVRLGLGGTNGSGRQHVSWIHAADFVRAVELLLTDEQWSGVVNLATPHAPTNREFMRDLRQAWGMPLGLPATEWMLALGAVLMRTESELVLKSRWVLPRRLQEAGFTFHFPHWHEAAADLVRSMRERRRSSR